MKNKENKGKGKENHRDSIIFVNPSFYRVYNSTILKEAIPLFPPLSLATLAAVAREAGYEPCIFDFNTEKEESRLRKLIQERKPKFVCITVVTALLDESKKIARLVKSIDKGIIVMCGGPHPSSFPLNTIKTKEFDIVVMGEGEETLKELLSSGDKKEKFGKINGMAYKHGVKCIVNSLRELSDDMNKLPFPAWDLYDLSKYRNNRLISRKDPAGWIETSRGCVFGCVYCNKSVFGRKFRVKSAERVVDEMEFMKKAGFNEIHIADDCFSTDIARAKKICDLIIQRKLKIHWATMAGLRVDKVDYELLSKMKKAGCYKTFFGIESGNQEILNRIRKGITLEQVRKAVKVANKADMEIWGAFMIGLPGETEQTMRDTINFAKSLDLDIAKMSITIPLPATPLYDEWNKNGLIKTQDWTHFSFYIPPEQIYNHPNLDWKTINKYYHKFYKEFYFRPRYIIRRFFKSLMRGTLLLDLKVLLKTDW